MNRIYKYIAAGILMIASVAMHAQENSPLEKFYDALADSYISFDCRYTFTPAKESELSGVGKVTGNAQIELQGESYIFDGNGLIVKSDGKSVCIIDDTSKEVIYESMPESFSENDYLQNPALLIRGIKDNFKTVSHSRIKDAYGEHVSDDYILEPVVRCGIDRCILSFVVYKDILPVINLDMTDSSNLNLLMALTDLHSRKPASYFSLPDPSGFDSSWVVTDLR